MSLSLLPSDSIEGLEGELDILQKKACTKRIISICLGLKRVLQVIGTIHFFTAEIQVVLEKTNTNRLLISIAPRS